MTWNATLSKLCAAFPGWSPNDKTLTAFRKKFGELNADWMAEAIEIYRDRETRIEPNAAKLHQVFREVAETKSDKPVKPDKPTLAQQSELWRSKAVSVRDKFPKGFAATVMQDVEEKIKAEGPLPINRSDDE